MYSFCNTRASGSSVDGAIDKGHLVRRDDVAWGDSFEDMRMGNGDTYHTTNCSPQVAKVQSLR